MGRMLVRIAAVAACVAVLAGLTWGVASIAVRMQDSTGAALEVAPVSVPGSTTPAPAPTDPVPAPPEPAQPPAPVPADPAPVPVQPAPVQPAPPVDDDDDDDDDFGEIDDD